MGDDGVVLVYGVLQIPQHTIRRHGVLIRGQLGHPLAQPFFMHSGDCRRHRGVVPRPSDQAFRRRDQRFKGQGSIAE